MVRAAVSEVVGGNDCRPFIGPKKETIELNLTISHCLLYCLSNIAVAMWSAVLKGMTFGSDNC
jgi:hypothetical protein